MTSEPDYYHSCSTPFLVAWMNSSFAIMSKQQPNMQFIDDALGLVAHLMRREDQPDLRKVTTHILRARLALQNGCEEITKAQLAYAHQDVKEILWGLV